MTGDAESKNRWENVKKICVGRTFEKTRGEGMDRENACLLVDHIWFQYQKQTPFILKG